MGGGMVRPWLHAFVLLALTLVATPAWAQERRVALVVGADRYQTLTPLENGVNDARAVAQRLGALGFEVLEPVLNPTRQEFMTALDRFEQRLRGADTGLFFYAGHAVEVGGSNILLPVDAPAATSERTLRGAGINVSEILIDMLAQTRAAILILDSCRDNPLPRDTTRGNAPRIGGARGLAPIEAPARGDGGAFIMFSALPGRVALDRLPQEDRERNSLFTRHLLRALEQPARPLSLLMQSVRDDVARAARAAGREQQPHLDDRMIGSGQLMLARGAAVVPSPVPTPAPAPESLDLAFWQSIQNSRNLADFEAYLTQFPQGRFVALARNRVAELRRAPQSAPTGYPVAVGQAFRDCADCPEMVVIPAGRFRMGSAENEPGRQPSEALQREVVLSAPLAVGRFHVTVGEYRAFVAATRRGEGVGCWSVDGSGGWGFQRDRNWRAPGFVQTDRDPVVCVDWDDARAYAAWLSQRTGRSYRLLTEAEWEYAARGGATTPFWWGTEEGQGCRHANGPDQMAQGRMPQSLGRTFVSCSDGFAFTSPAGSFPANRFGLHDMSGNAWQWVQDCWRGSFASAPVDAGTAVESFGCPSRVLRGGSWIGDPEGLRASARGSDRPYNPSLGTGFRLARTPG